MILPFHSILYKYFCWNSELNATIGFNFKENYVYKLCSIDPYSTFYRFYF